MKPILTFAFAALFAISVYAQGQKTELIRVALNISGDDQIKNEIRSYISRDLRSLKDVLLVVNDPQLRIGIVAISNETVSGRTIGYTLSVVVTDHLREDEVEHRKKLLNNEMIRNALLSEIVEGLSNDQLRTHNLYINTDLQRLCKSLVAEIDGSVFEINRLASQRAYELLSEPRQGVSATTPITPKRTKTTKKP